MLHCEYLDMQKKGENKKIQIKLRSVKSKWFTTTDLINMRTISEVWLILKAQNPALSFSKLYKYLYSHKSLHRQWTRREQVQTRQVERWTVVCFFKKKERYQKYET